MPLARRPDLALAVSVHPYAAGVRLDVALVNGRGLEVLLDHDIGFLEALLDIADREFKLLGDVRRLGRRGLDATGDHVLEEQRCVFTHRVVDIDRVRQHLVVDLEQRLGLLGNLLRDRGDRSDRVAVIKRLFLGHHIARHMPEIDRDALRADVLEFVVGKIGAGDDRLDAGQGLGLRGVDRLDARMGVRRAHDLAIERAGHRQVGRVHRAARDFGHAVRTDRPSSHPLVTRRRNIVHGGVSSLSNGLRRV